MSNSAPDPGAAVPVAEVRDLEKSYGEVRALRGISFRIPAGEIVGFLGPNGAGKTTAMKILTGYLAADAGTARVCGFAVEQEPLEVKRRVGYLPENNPLYPEQRVLDFLRFAYRARRLPRSGEAAALDRVVTGTGLEPVYARPIGECSKGYRQRVGLAQALLHDPPLLILDEPTNGLDPNQVREIHQLILELGRTKTVLLTSHVLPEVEALAGRVVLISQGSKVADAFLRELVGGGEGPVRARLVLRGGRRQLDAVLAAAGARLLGSEPAGYAGGACIAAEVEVPDLPAGLEALGRAAAGEGVPLVEMTPRARSLESMFRMLTGGTEEQ